MQTVKVPLYEVQVFIHNFKSGESNLEKKENVSFSTGSISLIFSVVYIFLITS